MALDSPMLEAVLRDVDSGALQLPDFQREWKWDDERIKALLSTVTLNYPLGVIMTLKTSGRPPFKARPLSGALADGRKTLPGQLLLDGQQRITSLYQALFCGQPVETRDSRGKELKRWYYIDIEKAITPDYDRDDAIVSVPESKRLTEDFGRRVTLDVSTQSKECEAGLFPLHAVFDTDKTFSWMMEYVQSGGTKALWPKFVQRVLNNVQSFQIPTISLDTGTPKEAVCAVFERVNTGGVVLNVFELLTATYAGDDSHVPEYHLPAVWSEIRKDLCTKFPVLGNPDREDVGISSSDFLQAISLVRTYRRKKSGRGNAVACKRKELLDLPLADFIELAPLLKDAFGWVGEFLDRQHIFSTDDVPYRTQLIPLAAVRALLGELTDGVEMAAQLERWYWCGVLGEMYGGSTESRFSRDVEQLIDRAGEPDTVIEASFRAGRLDTLTTRNSAAYKGIFALIMKAGARDWYYSEGPMDQSIVIGQYVDIRQIFPKNWFARNRSANDPHMASIVNKTMLSYRASRSMTGAPSMYIRVMAKESGYPEAWFDDVLASHQIDPEALAADDFDAFYRLRSEALLQLVEQAMGTKVGRAEATE